MAITTLSGVQSHTSQTYQFVKQNGATSPAFMPSGRMIGSWLNSTPAGVQSTGAGGAVRSNSSAQVTGTIPFYDPASGNSYLALLVASQRNVRGCSIVLCDRLWDASQTTVPAAISATINTTQTINSVTWPARDATGTTNGVDVYIALESTAFTTASVAGTVSISYTNSAGTASRTGTNIATMPNSTAIPSSEVFLFNLQAGDVGVQSVQSLTFSAVQTSGTAGLFAYRMLAQMELYANNYSRTIDALTSGFPRLYNGTVPFFLFTSSGTISIAAGIAGCIMYCQG